MPNLSDSGYRPGDGHQGRRPGISPVSPGLAAPGFGSSPVPTPGPAGVHVLPAPRQRLSFGTRLLGLAVVVVAILVAVWWIMLVAAAVWRFLELAAVTVLAGYAGWRLGVRHGRRHPGAP